MIDIDQDNRVTLEEFVIKYLDTREKLTERLNETCKKILDHKKQRDEMFDKLQQVKVIPSLPKTYRIANRGVHSECPDETYDGQFPNGACGGGTRPVAHGHGWHLGPICHPQDGGPIVGDRREEVHSEPSLERVLHFRDQPRDHAPSD